MDKEPFKPMKMKNVNKACRDPDEEDSSASADQESRNLHTGANKPSD